MSLSGLRTLEFGPVCAALARRRPGRLSRADRSDARAASALLVDAAAEADRIRRAAEDEAREMLDGARREARETVARERAAFVDQCRRFASELTAHVPPILTATLEETVRRALGAQPVQRLAEGAVRELLALRLGELPATLELPVGVDPSQLARLPSSWQVSAARDGSDRSVRLHSSHGTVHVSHGETDGLPADGLDPVANAFLDLGLSSDAPSPLSDME